jgi:hypothetical protein
VKENEVSDISLSICICAIKMRQTGHLSVSDLHLVLTSFRLLELLG